MAEVKVVNLQRAFTYKRTDKIEQKQCLHVKILVCEETRTIECESCQIILDPFEYLRKVCYQEESAFTLGQALKNEVARLEKRYANLNKEIERLNKVKQKLK